MMSLLDDDEESDEEVELALKEALDLGVDTSSSRRALLAHPEVAPPPTQLSPLSSVRRLRPLLQPPQLWGLRLRMQEKRWFLLKDRVKGTAWLLHLRKRKMRVAFRS
jgi:hypothetical protein